MSCPTVYCYIEVANKKSWRGDIIIMPSYLGKFRRRGLDDSKTSSVTISTSSPLHSLGLKARSPQRSVLRVNSLAVSLHNEGLFSDDDNSANKEVRFGQVRIRDYERVIGDNPSVTCGAPISIGWKYVELEPFSVEQFEEIRQGSRRNRSQMIMSREVRWKVLTTDWHVSRQEWAKAVRGVGRAKHRRRMTVVNLDKEEIELFFENCFRGTKKTFKKLLRNNRDKEALYCSTNNNTQDFMEEAMECQQDGALDKMRRKKFQDLGIEKNDTSISNSTATNKTNSTGLYSDESDWEREISMNGDD